MTDLIISAKNGDQEAFGSLYESCRKTGISIAKQYVKNDTDAEDMYQDAFLKAMENIDRFDENREFGPWLNTIIANTCKDFLGKKRPMNFTDMSDEENEFVDTIASSDESSLPESVYVRKEMLKIVDGIVEMLPNEQKEATLLFYFKDFSVKQVAEYQHVSEDTVKSRLNYSRKKVEQATRDYEKKNGIKIFSASVVPAILVLYFKNSVYAAHLDSTLTALSAGSGSGAAATGAAKTATGAIKAGTAAGTGAGALNAATAIATVAAWKIVAAAVIGTVAIAGAGIGIHHFVTSNDRDETVAEESENELEESEAQETETQEEAVAEEEELTEEEKKAWGYINDEGYYVFGSYEQDGDISNGPEPIEWEILDQNENGTLLISRYVLDFVEYDQNGEDVTWETCSLRSWMNNDFYDAAFDDEMKASINTVTIVNEDNPKWGTNGGKNTNDKIFCLSFSEILKYYSFNSWYSDDWYGYSQSLIIPSTKYATGSAGTAYSFTITNEVYEDWASDENYSEESIGMTGYTWWLRTPGADNGIACAVASDGSMYHNNGHFFISRRLGVRPALYINEGAQEKPVAEEESTANGYINDEGYYVFGSYEQDGDESNGPEPIEWEILDQNENGTLIVSRYVLDRVHYHNWPSDATWEKCLLRSWINENFYNTAFDDEEKESINTVTIANEDNPWQGTPGGNDTSDNIFVLSISEIMKYYPDSPKEGMGYCESLMIPATPYAESRGVSTYTVKENDLKDLPEYFADKVGESGACWWLRSPGLSTYSACSVSGFGYLEVRIEDTSKDEDYGVRPALYINANVSWDPGTRTESVSSEEPVAEETVDADGYINDEGYYVFGLYEQDGDKSNGPEPIEWEILDENENGTLLISRYVLDSVLYDIRSTSEVTWEDCNLRSWMNDDFYNAAFDDEMKERINTVTITTEDNQYWETSGGNDTRDRIFALSVSEILKYYSFNSWDSAMHRGQSQELMIPATKYAKDREVSTITITENNYQFYSSHYNYTEDCIGRTGAKWWLRTPGKNSSIACIVDMYGQAGENGSIVMPGGWAGDVGVRPALYVNM